jgi:hypothetical protein
MTPAAAPVAPFECEMTPGGGDPSAGAPGMTPGSARDDSRSGADDSRLTGLTPEPTLLRAEYSREPAVSAATPISEVR